MLIDATNINLDLFDKDTIEFCRNRIEKLSREKWSDCIDDKRLEVIKKYQIILERLEKEHENLYQ